MSAVKLEGWNEFIALVEQLPDKMKKKEIAGVIRKNMKPIAETIRANTPERSKDRSQSLVIKRRKDGSISTVSQVGNLKKSIGVRTFSRKGTEVTGYAGIQSKSGRGSDEFEKALNRSDGWYGFFLERGTKHISKRPFIAPSAAIAVPQAADQLGTDISEYIAKNARRLGLDAKVK